MAFKIWQDHDICIGCGACAAICPSDWKMEGDKAILTNAKKEGSIFSKPAANITCNRDAESACPVKCIHVEETK